MDINIDDFLSHLDKNVSIVSEYGLDSNTNNENISFLLAGCHNTSAPPTPTTITTITEPTTGGILTGTNGLSCNPQDSNSVTLSNISGNFMDANAQTLDEPSCTQLGLTFSGSPITWRLTARCLPANFLTCRRDSDDFTSDCRLFTSLSFNCAQYTSNDISNNNGSLVFVPNGS